MEQSVSQRTQVCDCHTPSFTSISSLENLHSYEKATRIMHGLIGNDQRPLGEVTALNMHATCLNSKYHVENLEHSKCQTAHKE